MHQDLLEFLGLPRSSTEDDASAALVALIASATHEDSTTHSLKKIHGVLCQTGAASLLDPLNTLPLLLPCKVPESQDILGLIGDDCSAKEVVIGVQEALERLHSFIQAETVDDANDEDSIRRSPSSQVLMMVRLYGSAIPRQRFRSKPASEIVRPLLSDLQSTMDLASRSSSRDEGREIIIAVSVLVEKVLSWAHTQHEVRDIELRACNDILEGLIAHTLTSYSHCIQAALAQRSFKECFPRLALRSSLDPGWENGVDSVARALDAFTALGLQVEVFPAVPSLSYLILLAHAQPSDWNPTPLLTFMLPVLIASIQANSALDEALSLLMRALHLQRTRVPLQELSPDLIIPLSTVLPSLASVHSDPAVRHQTFRVLALLLSLTPGTLRLQILKDLTSEEDFPQMRSAAVGLVKEAVLEGLSAQNSKSNIFASKHFVQVFGPILFRPNPPNFFSSQVSIGDLEESMEPSRLTECLSLYFVLLLRDIENRTGIRDADSISKVEKTLLAPLRSALERWMDDPGVATGHLHDIMPLVSLKTGLERVDDVISQLKSTIQPPS